MKSVVQSVFIAMLLLPVPPCLADAADVMWEQHISAKLVQYLQPDSIIWGAVEDIQFLSLFTGQSTEQQAPNAVMILHTMGAHPDWPGIIHMLRMELARHDWSTLAIQLPLLAPQKPLTQYGQTLADAGKRIETAIKLLLDRGIANIAIVGHGFGAVAAVLLLADKPQQKVTTLVGIGMHAPLLLTPAIDLQGSIEQLTFPVLDLFGSRDYELVLKQAEQRRQMRWKNKEEYAYQQIVVEGADHFFVGLEQVLVGYIRGWLRRHGTTSSAVADRD